MIVPFCQVDYSTSMRWHSWILAAKKRILMEMDTTVTWTTEMKRQHQSIGVGREGETAIPPVTDCYLKYDGNSQSTNISSLACSTAISDITAEERNAGTLENAFAFQEVTMDDMDQLTEELHNTGEIFAWTEEAAVNNTETPTRQKQDDEITSPSGFVTESSKTLIMDDDMREVRKNSEGDAWNSENKMEYELTCEFIAYKEVRKRYLKAETSER